MGQGGSRALALLFERGSKWLVCSIDFASDVPSDGGLQKKLAIATKEMC